MSDQNFFWLFCVKRSTLPPKLKDGVFLFFPLVNDGEAKNKIILVSSLVPAWSFL